MSSSSPGSSGRKPPAKKSAAPSSSEDESSELTTSTEDITTSDESDSDPPPSKSTPRAKPIVMGHEVRKKATPPPRLNKFKEEMDFNLDDSKVGKDTTPGPSRGTSKAPSEKRPTSRGNSQSRTASEGSDSDTANEKSSGKASSSASRAQSRSTSGRPSNSSEEDDAETSKPPTRKTPRRQSTADSTSSRQPRSRTRTERTPVPRGSGRKPEYPPESNRNLSSVSTLNNSTRSGSAAVSRSRSRPTDPSDPERGAFKGRDLQGDDDYGGNDCCGNCGCCSGCTDCWTSMVQWRMWSWLRQKSAFIIGFLICLGMAAIGGAGMMDWWVFANVGGYDLGGLGYCQGGACIIQPAYNVEVGSANFFLRPQTLSILLLTLGGAGIVFTALFIWMTLNATCGDTFTPPHTVFLCCFFNEPPRGPTEEEINRAGEDNGFDPAEWQGQSRKKEMILEVRVKDYFQKIMFYWVWPAGVVLVGLSWIWVEVTKAEEKLAFQAAVWGGMAMLVLYILAVNVYRPTSHRASQQQLSEGWNEAARKTKALRARAASEVKDLGETAVQKAKDLRHDMTPAGREEARRRR